MTGWISVEWPRPGQSLSSLSDGTMSRSQLVVNTRVFWQYVKMLPSTERVMELSEQ